MPAALETNTNPFLWSVSDRFLTEDFSSLRIRMVSFEPLKETSALFTGQTLACCHGTDMKATLSFIDYQQTFHGSVWQGLTKLVEDETANGCGYS